MDSIKRSEICRGVNFTYIPEKKFKTTRLSFSMFTPLSEENVSKNAVLSSLLAHSCKKYPSLFDVSLRLEELYGASISPSLEKLGETQVITLAARSINNNFVPNSENNILNVADLLCEMIFEPDVENESFKEKNMAQEKRQLIEDIESEMNDKRIYAYHRCEEIMCQNEKFGINPLGTIRDAKNLNGKDVYKSWQRLLSSSHIEIMTIGSCAPEPVIKKFENYFSKIKRDNIDVCQTEVVKKAENIYDICEIMDVTQCKLVLGFRTETAKPSNDVEAVKVMAALLGGTPQSKLFLNVREKLSLCYYCSARYNAQKGIMFIESGVEQKNVQKAKAEILEQIKELKIGNFSNTEFLETKMFITQSIEKTKDNLSALDAWYTSETFDEIKDTPDDKIEKINKVTREQVVDAANKLTLDTVYILSGKEE